MAVNSRQTGKDSMAAKKESAETGKESTKEGMTHRMRGTEEEMQP